MYLTDTDISCGIVQLAEIGMDPSETELVQQIKEAEEEGFGIILASLADNEGTKPVKLLLKHGFRQTGKWKINVNSGNRIALFVKRCRAKKPDEDCYDRGY